jgi:hypothetical protein
MVTVMRVAEIALAVVFVITPPVSAAVLVVSSVPDANTRLPYFKFGSVRGL